jgi:hypothetical protein
MIKFYIRFCDLSEVAGNQMSVGVAPEMEGMHRLVLKCVVSVLVGGGIIAIAILLRYCFVPKELRGANQAL